MADSRNDELLRQFRERNATVAIIGLGYVGLPLARAMGNAGFRVIGLDIDRDKVEMLKRGETYIPHPPADQFSSMIERGRLLPTTEFSTLGEADAVIICVPTPLTRHRDPDLSYIIKTAKNM